MLTPQQIVTQQAAAIQNLPADNPYGQAVELIYQHCHQQGGKVLTTGVGKAGCIAQKIAVTLSSTGTSAQFLHPLEAVHGDMGILKPEDVLIAISNSGKTREIVELIPLAKRLAPNLSVISITKNPESELAQQSEVTLATGNPAETCPLGMTPTTSTTVMSVLGDIITVQLMQKINLTKDQYALRHHGGYLGSKARGEVQEQNTGAAA